MEHRLSHPMGMKEENWNGKSARTHGLGQSKQSLEVRLGEPQKKERTGFRTATSIDSLTFQMKEPISRRKGHTQGLSLAELQEAGAPAAKQPLLRGNIAGKLQAGHAHKAWIS